MDKIEEIALNNTHVWGPEPYNKVKKFSNCIIYTVKLIV